MAARKRSKKSARQIERDVVATRGRFNVDQPEDPRPGYYYVTAMDSGRSARAAGPYGTHAAALDDVYRVKEEIERGDPRAAFYAWGTMRSETDLGPGFLSAQSTRSHQRTKDRGVVYTDAMIAAMCDAPWYWEAQIRAAAKQRNVKVTSVTPLADVVRGLRATAGERRAHQRKKKDRGVIEVFGGWKVDLDRGGKLLRESVDLRTPGDYGADPLGDGRFKMVPSGDIVDYAERTRRLDDYAKRARRSHQTRPSGTGTFLVQYIDKLGTEREVYVSNTTDRAVRADARKAGFRVLAVRRTGR